MTNVYSYDRESQGQKSEEHNQMVDLPKLLRQLSLARVVLKRLSITSESTKLRITNDLAPVDVAVVDQAIDVNVPQDEHVPPNEYIDDHEESNADPVAIGGTRDIVDDVEQKFADGSTATCNRHSDLIKRNCPKCKILVADAKIKSKQLCTQCDTPLSYQCARCDKQYNFYSSLLHHLNIKCNAQNLNLKCPKCDYQTHVKKLMYKHKTYCSSRTIYSCSHCEFKTRDRSNLDVHMRLKHEVADGSTATCDRKKPADLIKRSCPICKTLVADASVSKKQSCAKCDTPLSYQCARCDKQYNYYSSLSHHLNIKCNAQNLNLKCPKCNYQTHSEKLMSRHNIYCSSRTIYSCSHCEFKTRDGAKLVVHMRIKHEVTDESTAICNRTMPADLIKRNCPKCKTLVADARACIKQSCAKCDTPLNYQCARCDTQYNHYQNLFLHLSMKCNAQNLDLSVQCVTELTQNF